MRRIILFSHFFVLYATALHVPSQPGVHRNLTDHSHAHAYTSAYSFDRRDGWETVSISNLNHKHSSQTSTEDVALTQGSRHALKRRLTRKNGDQRKSITGTIQNVVGAIKGFGKMEHVIITWYTGKDLQNPSCWHKSAWTPTDASFACAVTLDGWKNRPKCFQFLELCHGPERCIFVRVVDTCAGCAKGSKHVDLTKAAFQALASLDQGKLQANMRLATNPEEWHESLWGPKNV